MPSNRAEPTAVGARDDRFEGVIAGHHFSIAVDGGAVIAMQANAWTWQVGDGTLDVTASGPIDASTQFLVDRSPRTIVRSPMETDVSIVTEVVVTAGGRMFTCVHQQRVTDERTPEATAIRERGVAACSTLHVDP